jgi:transglutaminase-like putative cysteine protease
MPREWIVGVVVVTVVVAVVLASVAFLILTREETPPSGGEITTTPTTPLPTTSTTTPTTTPSIAEFEEFDESFIYIDADGDARCTLVGQLPPSQLCSFMKQITALMGVDVMKQSYEESIRGSQARYGLEVENVLCEVTGLGPDENFKIVLTWETPKMASWSDNRWTISFSLVDNQSAAKEIIANEESNWTFIRSVAGSSGVDVALYRISYRSVMVLPEGAEDVYSEIFGSHEVTDYGGGSYVEDSVSLGQVDGKPAIIENAVTLIATENEITITWEQYLEQFLAYTISYGGVSPENPSSIDSLEQPRLDLKYGRELSDRYLVYGSGSWYSLTPAQLLYYTAEAITTISQGGQFSIQQPIENITEPDSESGEWGACWENLSKAEYVSLAQAVLDEISGDKVAPGEIESSIGKMRFRDVLYTFTRILSRYGKSGELPGQINIAPVPSGELSWGGRPIPASHAYYLLPDTYVITNTNGVNEVLDNIRDSLDNRRLAEEICNWTGSNITYQLYFTPPTSEEVLASREGQCRDFTNVYLAMARTAGIPARRVSGWIVSEWQPPAGWEFVVTTLPDGKTVASHAWVQVYLLGEGWVPVEPQSKRPTLYVGTLPYEISKQSEQTWMSALAGYEAASGLL